jgi:hypothetical protein
VIAAAPVPAPVLGRSVVVERIAGIVRLRQPGASFLLVTRPIRLRVGGELDITAGRARVVAARDARGRRESGVFRSGLVRVAQDRAADSPVDLRLVGGDFGRCARRAAGPRPPPISVRRLWSHTTGRFRTVGRFSSATVRGTTWLTEDRCDGTRTLDRAGIVLTVSNAGQVFRLRPGTSIVYFCSPRGAPPVSRDYCIALLQDPDGLFGAGVITISPDDDRYQLCVDGPRSDESCTSYPLTPPDQFGFRRAVVSCIAADGPGDYLVRWLVRGVQLGPALTYTARRLVYAPNPCLPDPAPASQSVVPGPR